MTQPYHPEFVEGVKHAFTATPEYAGYDADDAPGYFAEYVLNRLHNAETRVRDIAAAFQVWRANKREEDWQKLCQLADAIVQV